MGLQDRLGVDNGGNMKLTKKEKASYGLGAVGKDMAYMLSASYLEQQWRTS